MLISQAALLGVAVLTGCSGGGSSTPAPAPDFSVTITAPPATRAGTGGSTAVSVGRTNGHVAAITVSLASNTQGITGSGSIAASAASGTLAYTVPASLAGGTYTLTANASDGTLTHSATLTLTTLPYPPNFPAASVVIGQANFISNTANQGGTAAANTLYAPYGNPCVINGVLYLPDYANNRILGYNTVPTANNASASFVLGQPDMSTATYGNAANQVRGPETIKTSNGKMLVCDYGNHRVLIWNTAPTTTQASPNVVVGQPDFGSSVQAATRTGMSYPESIEVAGGRLIVGDSNNNRVLIWNTIPTANGAPADLVLGQGDFTHNKANDDNQDGTADAASSARTMNYPCGVWSDGTRLIVADSSNNRLLIWTTFPTTNFQPANIVIGQSDFLHKAWNDDAQTGTNGTTPSARTMSFPYYIESNGSQLYVGDSSNRRVLIWDSIPTVNFSPANRVLGQSDFIHNARNDDNQDGADDTLPSVRTFSSTTGLYLFGGKLFVSDSSNSRCLVFDNP